MSPQDDEDDENDSVLKERQTRVLPTHSERSIEDPPSSKKLKASVHLPSNLSPPSSPTSKSKDPSPPTKKPPPAPGTRDELTKSHPSMNDVRCGRGIPIQNYPGNVRFHAILNSYREKYQTIPRNDKSDFIKKIVREVKLKGLQFLNRKSKDESSKDGSSDDDWEVMDDAFIYEKISHGLRRRDQNTQVTKATISSAREKVDSNQNASMDGSRTRRINDARDKIIHPATGVSGDDACAAGHPPFFARSQSEPVDIVQMLGLTAAQMNPDAPITTDHPTFQQGFQLSQLVNDPNNTAAALNQVHQYHSGGVPSAFVPVTNHQLESFESILRSMTGGAQAQQSPLQPSTQSFFASMLAPQPQSHHITQQDQLVVALLSQLLSSNQPPDVNSRLQDNITTIMAAPPSSMNFQHLSGIAPQTLLSTLLGTALGGTSGAPAIDPCLVESLVDLLQKSVTSAPPQVHIPTSAIPPHLLNLSNDALASLLLTLTSSSSSGTGSSSNSNRNSGNGWGGNFDPSQHNRWL